MTTETQNTKQDDALFDRLQSILEAQIDRIRKGDIEEVEKLSMHTHLLITEIDEKGLFRNPQFKTRHEDITKLYQKLNLMLSAAKETISQELRKVGKGKKMIQAYRHGA